MNIIYFSIFFLRRRIFSRHKCRFFYAAFGQLLRESWQFECWYYDGKRRSLADMIETRTVGVLCVSKRIDGRGTKRNSWGRLQVAAGRVIQW